MFVARRGKDDQLLWVSWSKLPNLHVYKKLYKSNPELFSEKNGKIFLESNKLNIKRVNELFNSCLKISGSCYALALSLSGGDRRSAEFIKTFKTLESREFSDSSLWTSIFEQHIKTFATRVAIVKNGATNWLESYDSEISSSVFQSYFSIKPELFERVGDDIFYLETQNILIENMFFKCVELAGSEWLLACNFGKNETEKVRHLKNFERMGFKHRENFETYAKLFSDFLKKTQTLFCDDKIMA